MGGMQQPPADINPRIGLDAARLAGQFERPSVELVRGLCAQCSNSLSLLSLDRLAAAACSVTVAAAQHVDTVCFMDDMGGLLASLNGLAQYVS